MKKLYMIGNAHLDPVWLWPWQEGFQENKATCRSALDRMKEFEDVVFTSSSAQFYEWIEENDQEMFAEIEDRIKEGRWKICGGWWVQPDCNIPSGESFARHALLSQNYFNDKFGITAKTGYNVDSFGHHGMLPQILRLSGMENYVFMRPNPQEKGLPGRNFIWESDDGSRVRAFRIPFAYCSFEKLEEHMRACLEEFDAGIDALMCFYGVGNHGGGPTVDNIRTIKRLKEEWEDTEIMFSDPDTYFQDLKEKDMKLPVVHGDLQHHASGCYSAHSQIKWLNRRAENALLRAEKFAVLAELAADVSYPPNFTGGWKRVLFHQFHDILAGTGIKDIYFDSRNEYGEALAIAARNENNSLQSLSFHIGIEKEDNMLPVVVFNPHSWEVEENVEIETGAFSGCGCEDKFVVKDSQEKEYPVQEIVPEAKMYGRRRFVFTARIPSLGYAVFRIYAVSEKQEAKQGLQGMVLENSRLRVKFDEKTGGISSVWRKEEKIEFCDGVIGKAAVMEDDSDTWAHEVFRFQDMKGYFVPVSVKKTEEGEVRSSVRVISTYGKSSMVQTYTLYKHEEMVRVSVRINWQEKFKCLKLQFPVKLKQYHGTYEIPFGSIEKACNGEEEPMQRWMDMTGIQDEAEKTVCGLTVLNNGKYSASMEKNRMDLTVLRSPVYAHHNPYRLTQGEEEYSFMEQGEQEFQYILFPHMGSLKHSGGIRKAEELNQPCACVTETFHGGEYPQKASYLTVSHENIVLSALKKAEKSDAYIARFYETAGECVKAEIWFGGLGKNIQSVFRPYEIKTFKISLNPDEEPVETDFMEWEINQDTDGEC